MNSMMNIERFLATFWEECEGTRFIMYRNARGVERKVRHVHVETNAHAARIAAHLAPHNDVWFSPSLFKPKSDRRTSANVESINALWIDFDADSEANLTRLLEICRTDFGVEPMIVRTSERGYHVYLLLNTRYNREKWTRYAHALRRYLTERGIHADWVSTVDAARVLRVPHTLNHKYEPAQEVTLIAEHGETRFDPTKLNAYVDERLSVNDVSDINEEFTVSHNASDAHLVAEECAQMRHVMTTRGNVPEPLWYAALGVLAYCDDGERLAHEWSCGHPKYTAEETAEKFRRARNFPPSLCQRFETVNPQGCANCPHRGKIRTPVILGRGKTADVDALINEALSNEQAATENDEVAIKISDVPPPPRVLSYRIADDGVYYLGGEQPEKIIGAILYVARTLESANGGELAIELVHLTRETGLHRHVLAAKVLADKKKLDETLRSIGVFSYQPKQIGKLSEYLVASTQACVTENRQSVYFDRLGWHGDSFVLGNHLITTDGITTANISSRVSHAIIERLQPRGTSQTWIEATRYLDRPEYWPHRTTILAAFAAPLMRLFGQTGAILSLAGVSGTAKTTAARFALSLYGHPMALETSANSTENAFIEVWRMLNNLPMLIDEAGVIHDGLKNKLCYSAVNGMARRALTVDRSLRDESTWSTITILTTNRHFLEFDERVLDEAVKRRIIELTVNDPLDSNIAALLNEVAVTNYGWVGRKYMMHVVRNKATIVKRLNEKLTVLRNEEINARQRFALWFIAALSVAAEIATKLRLIMFAWNDIPTRLVQTVRVHDRKVLDKREQVADIIVDYIHAHTGEMTRYDLTTKNWYALDENKREVNIRLDMVEDEVESYAVRYSAIRDYADSRGIDPVQFAEGVALLGLEKRAVKLARYLPAARAVIVPAKILAKKTLDTAQEVGYTLDTSGLRP